MNIIAIDTSIAACGVAVLVDDKIHLTTIRPQKKGDLVSRCRDLERQLVEWLPLIEMAAKETSLIIEIPTFQESERGKTFAVGGGMVKLSFTAGWIAGMELVSTVETTLLVTPQGWKGMLSKDQTRARLLNHPLLGKQLRNRKFDHNAADAAAILMWYLDRKPKVNYDNAEIIYLR